MPVAFCGVSVEILADFVNVISVIVVICIVLECQVLIYYERKKSVVLVL